MDRVIDDADQVVSMEAAAMERFEAERARERLRVESMRPFDPSLPINCVDCGEVVPQTRLKALPHTRRCAGCAHEVERRYREMGP